MKMIPSSPVPTTASAAERRVFELLEATPMPEAVGLHSLRVSRHPDKVSGEADFVVLRPDALLVIEVKGGRVRQSGGVWYYRDRNNVDHPSREGPFRQAEGAMYGLRDRLAELLDPSTLDGMAFGFVVATPDCSLPVANVEWDRETLIDAATLRGLTDLEVPLRRAVDYWRSRRKMGPSRTATSVETAAVLDACRPDFEPVRSLATSVAGIAEEMVSLTTEQYRVLDLAWDWDRLVIEGGAGTGKTLLGAEAARRHSEAGRDVLLTCRSPVLASWLRSRVPDRVRVVSHRALTSQSGPFDVLICDEAQDVLEVDALDVLDGLISGGLDNGRWLFLLDPNHQTGVLGTFDAAVYELIKSQADGRPLKLTSNVRNTTVVLQEVSLVTGAPLDESLVTGQGSAIADFAERPQDEAAIVRGWLRECRREGLDPGGVTIVTPDGAARFLEHLPEAEHRGIRKVGGPAAREWPIAQPTLASAHDFKGLENDMVIVADLWDTDPHENRNILYVAMTRSRVALRVVWPASRRDEIDRLKSGNIHVLRNAK